MNDYASVPAPRRSNSQELPKIVYGTAGADVGDGLPARLPVRSSEAGSGRATKVLAWVSPVRGRRSTMLR